MIADVHYGNWCSISPQRYETLRNADKYTEMIKNTIPSWTWGMDILQSMHIPMGEAEIGEGESRPLYACLGGPGVGKTAEVTMRELQRCLGNDEFALLVSPHNACVNNHALQLWRLLGPEEFRRSVLVLGHHKLDERSKSQTLEALVAEALIPHVQAHQRLVAEFNSCAYKIAKLKWVLTRKRRPPNSKELPSEVGDLIIAYLGYPHAEFQKAFLAVSQNRIILENRPAKLKETILKEKRIIIGTIGAVMNPTNLGLVKQMKVDAKGGFSFVGLDEITLAHMLEFMLLLGDIAPFLSEMTHYYLMGDPGQNNDTRNVPHKLHNQFTKNKLQFSVMDWLLIRLQKVEDYNELIARVHFVNRTQAGKRLRKKLAKFVTNLFLACVSGPKTFWTTTVGTEKVWAPLRPRGDEGSVLQRFIDGFMPQVTTFDPNVIPESMANNSLGSVGHSQYDLRVALTAAMTALELYNQYIDIVEDYDRSPAVRRLIPSAEREAEDNKIRKPTVAIIAPYKIMAVLAQKALNMLHDFYRISEKDLNTYFQCLTIDAAQGGTWTIGVAAVSEKVSDWSSFVFNAKRMLVLYSRAFVTMAMPLLDGGHVSNSSRTPEELLCSLFELQQDAETTLFRRLHHALRVRFSPDALWELWLRESRQYIEQASSSTTDNEETMETPVRASQRESRPTELLGCKLTFLRLLKHGIRKQRDDWKNWGELFENIRMKGSINNPKLGKNVIVGQRIKQEHAEWFYGDFVTKMNKTFGTSKSYFEDGALFGLFLRPVERSSESQLYSVAVNGMQCKQWNETAMRRMEWICFQLLVALRHALCQLKQEKWDDFMTLNKIIPGIEKEENRFPVLSDHFHIVWSAHKMKFDGEDLVERAAGGNHRADFHLVVRHKDGKEEEQYRSCLFVYHTTNMPKGTFTKDDPPHDLHSRILVQGAPMLLTAFSDVVLAFARHFPPMGQIPLECFVSEERQAEAFHEMRREADNETREADNETLSGDEGPNIADVEEEDPVVSEAETNATWSENGTVDFTDPDGVVVSEEEVVSDEEVDYNEL